MTKNIEIRMLVFRPNGTFKSLILEESGKGEDKSPKPEHTETTKLDRYFTT